MSGILSNRFWGARLPFVFVVCVGLLNVVAILLMPPPGEPPAISFNSAVMDTREGEVAKLYIRVSPPCPKRIKLGLVAIDSPDDPRWRFGDSPLLRSTDDGAEIDVPGGRDEIAIPLEIFEDQNEREVPGRLAFNLKHLGPETVSGEFRSIEVSVRDPYIQPVVQFDNDEVLAIQEGEIEKIGVVVTGTVERDLLIPLTILGDTPEDVRVAGGNKILVKAGENAGVMDLRAIDDALYEGEERAVMQLAEGSDDFAVGENSELQLKILDSDSVPRFTIHLPKLVIQHNEDAIVQLRASGASDEPQEVEVSLAAVSPIAPETKDALPEKIMFFLPAGKLVDQRIAFDASVPWTQGYHQLELNAPGSMQRLTVTHAPVQIRANARGREEGDAAVIEVVAMLPSGTIAIEDNHVRLRGGGTATLGEDFTVLGGKPTRSGDSWGVPLVISEGQQAARVSLRVKDDAIYEGQEEILLELVEAGTGLGEKRSVNILVDDNESKPKLSLSVDKNEIFEGDEAQVTIDIAEGEPESSLPITANLSADPESTAVAGSHYEINNTEIVIPPGARSANTQLRVIDDTEADRGQPKTLKLLLKDIQNAQANDVSVDLTVKDNDTWLGSDLVLIGLTDDLMSNPEWQKIIDQLQDGLTSEERDNLVGGNFHCFDRNTSAMPEAVAAWGNRAKDPDAFLNALERGSVLGTAQKIEQYVTGQRPPGQHFQTIVIYPIKPGKSMRAEDRYVPLDTDNRRFVLFVGRSEDEISGELKADVEKYSGGEWSDSPNLENQDKFLESFRLLFAE